MKIVYLGTPDFAVLPLKKIFEGKKHQILAVVTNCDKPVGRKRILTAPPVKQFALENDIPVYQYEKIRIEGVEDMKKLNPDVMITCAFGQILSQEILDIPKFGVINIHASLLPKYRGASPIHYAILNGEKETGISVMKTDIGIDTGDVILQKSLNILDDENCGSLFDRLSHLGADCIEEALDKIEKGTATFTKQNDDEATLTKIIKKEDALIDWNQTANEVYNKIRAFNPAPIAYSMLNGAPFKIYEAKVLDVDGKMGTILQADKELVIACKKGAISLKTVQKAGGNAMQIADFLRGNKFTVGEEFV